jgi:hypothetical protein
MTIPTPAEVQARITTIKDRQIAKLRENTTHALMHAALFPVRVDVEANQVAGVVDVIMKELRALDWDCTFHHSSQRDSAHLQISFDKLDDPTGY